MKEIVMLKENLIPDTLERLIEIAGLFDRAKERLAQLSAKPATRELNNEFIKDTLIPLLEANAHLGAMYSQVTDEVTELVAAIDRAVLQVSRADCEEAADPLPGVMDNDESTSDEGGAP
jgi:hypothetical protein